jgi:hypothetical protein
MTPHKKKLIAFFLAVLALFIVVCVWFFVFFLPKEIRGAFKAFDLAVSEILEKKVIIPLSLIALIGSDKGDNDFLILFPEMKDYLSETDEAVKQAKIAEFTPKIQDFSAISSVSYAIYTLSSQRELPYNIYDIFKNKDLNILRYRYDYCGNQFVIERLDKTKILIFSPGKDKKKDLPKNEDLVSLSSEKWIKYIKKNDDIGAIIFLDK